MNSINLLKSSVTLYGRRGLKWFCIGLFASACIAAIELFVSIIIQILLISFGFISNDIRIGSILIPNLPIINVAILLLGVGFIRFLVQLISTQSCSFLRDYIGQKLRRNVVYSMLFSKNPEDRVPSVVNFRISEVFVKAGEFIFNLSLLLSMFIQSLLLLATLFFVAWKEACLAVIGVGFIGLVIMWINKNIARFAKQVPLEQRKLNEGVEKIARNFIFIKLMKCREKENNSLADSLYAYASKSLSANFFSNFSAQIGPFLGICLLVFIIIISQKIWHTNSLLLISFIYLQARFVQSLSIMSGYLGNTAIYYPQYRLALNTIQNTYFTELSNTKCYKLSFFGLPLFKMDEKHNLQASPILINSKKEIESLIKSVAIQFKQVSFAYQKTVPIFTELNWEILAGEQIGIIGTSGAGKSTLLMLLTGIIEPNSGEILINGQSVSAYMADIKNRIAYVGAEPFLIKGTLRDNLNYGLSVVQQDDVLKEILAQVALTDLLHESKGLDFIINEDQSGLSAGQKQRLCLARALLNNPALLILDEASANLDEKNEAIIADLLKGLKRSCTIIIVSHRAGILVNADKIINIQSLQGN